MAITPPGNKPFVPVLTPHPKSNALSESEEARNKVSSTYTKIKDAEREGQQRLDDIRDQFDRQEAMESEKHKAAIEANKSKLDEGNREQQIKQQAETNRIRNEGERNLSNVKNYYQNAILAAETEGRHQLHDIQQRNNQDLEYEKKNSNFERETERLAHSQKINNLQSNQEDAFAKLSTTAREEYERMKQQMSGETERANTHFQENFQNLTKSQKDTLGQISSSANRMVSEIRNDTAHKLAAYSSRQNDPFYKLLDLGAELHETDDAFILTAKVPEHEQDRISISVQGNQLMLSGQRRNEEKLELAPGHTQGTASFQSFSESFPLPFPVENRQISKELNGDQVTFRIPKKNYSHERTPFQAQRPARVRAERPQFPENLPGTKKKNEN